MGHLLRHWYTPYCPPRTRRSTQHCSMLLQRVSSLKRTPHSQSNGGVFHSVALTQHDIAIISRLSSSLPIIPVCTTALSLSPPQSLAPILARFNPHSSFALRTGLFRTPHSLAALRSDAADRFLRWREAERTFHDALGSLPSDGMRRRTTVTQASHHASTSNWDKAAWETMLSEDVSRRLREEKDNNEHSSPFPFSPAAFSFSTRPLCVMPTLDPLHLRSLFILSFSLLSPRPFMSSGDKATNESKAASDTQSTIRPSRSSRDHRWRWRLVSAFMGLSVFCAGIGIGLVLSS